MTLGKRIDFSGGSYEVRGIVDGRLVVRIRNRQRNTEDYKIWTEAERLKFDHAQQTKVDNADRNAQIYERFLAGEKKASLAREFALSPTTITQICARQYRKEKRG